MSAPLALAEYLPQRRAAIEAELAELKPVEERISALWREWIEVVVLDVTMAHRREQERPRRPHGAAP